MKQRLVGAAVLMALGVIFIPILLAPEDEPVVNADTLRIKRNELTGEFSSKVMPIEDEVVAKTRLLAADTPTVSDRASEPEQDQMTMPEKAPSNVQSPALDSLSEKHEAVAAEQPGMTAWVVQAGSFSSKENAEKMASQLREKAYTAYIEDIPGDKPNFRVRIGPLLSKARAEKTVTALKSSLGIDGLVLKYR